jgi:hypothetical protein
MRVPPSRRLSRLLLAVALLIGCAATGCGKGGAQRASSGAPALSVPSQGPTPPGAVGIATKNTTRLGGADAPSNAAAVARAVFPGLTPATRPQAVVLVNERSWAASLAASALAGAPLAAPVLYADGNSLPAPSAQALAALHPTGSAALEGAQVIEIGTSAPVSGGPRVRQLALGSEPGGDQAAAVSAAVERLIEALSGGTPRSFIVVPSEAPRSMQMPAAGLAAESGAPILFLGQRGVSAAVSSVLARAHHPSLYVVGASSLAAGARAALARFGRVFNASGEAGTTGATGPREGAEAVENAIAVARFGRGSFGWNIHEAGHGLVFASASHPLDAPAAAALSAHGDYAPLLLLEGAGSVPKALAHYLSNIEPGYSAAVPPVRSVYNHGWVIGDERAISARAQAEIDAALEVAPRSPSPEEAPPPSE